MYKVTAPKAFVFEDVWSDERSAVRTRRLLEAIGGVEPVTIAEEDIPAVIEANGLTNMPARGHSLPAGGDPVFFFNTLRFGVDDRKPVVDGVLGACPEGTSRHLVERLLGLSWTACGGPIRSGELICRKTNEFHTIDGCLHRCLYCSAGGNQTVTLGVNLEQFVDEALDPIVQANPWQQVFRYQTQVSDALCFEPEYGACQVFGDYFKRLGDRYLILHTSSANVEHLLDMGHQDNTIVLWSLTSDTVSRELEVRSGTTAERIEAARKCQEAGYTVRYKFKPIVPVRNWREECAEMIRAAFTTTQPDVVSLCVLMWMKPDEFDQLFDAALFDADYVDAMHEQAEAMRDRPCGPFPDPVRTELYSFFIDEIRKHNTTVPISLSTETKEVWAALGPKLGCTPHNYVCGCGAKCTPGLKVLAEPETFEL